MAAIAYPTGFDDVRRRPVRRRPAPSSRPWAPTRSFVGAAAPSVRPVVRPAARARRPARDVYRRRRIVVLAAAALVGAIAILLLRSAAGAFGGAPLASPAPSAAAAVQPAAAVTYVVRPGDTYWSIAENMHPPGDVRAVVDRLVASRQGAPLRAGETITLP